MTSYNGTTSYGYDAKDQLVSEAGVGYTNSFSYDQSASVGAGNSTTIRNTSGYGFNADNQFTNSGFGYDNEGNPTNYKSASLAFDAPLLLCCADRAMCLS